TFKGAKANTHVAVDANGGNITGTAPDITFTNAAPGHPGQFGFLDLPIFAGTQSFQVPIDFLDGTPGVDSDGQGVSLSTTTAGSGGTDEVQQISVTVSPSKCSPATRCQYQL